MTEPAVVAAPLPGRRSVTAAVADALPRRRRVALVATVAAVPIALAYFGLDAAGVVGVVFLAALAALALKDLEVRRVPNAIVFPATGIVVAGVAILRPGHLVESVVASVAAALFLLVPGLISRDAVGLGDVKLALLLGAALGRGVAMALLLGCLAASIVGVFLIVRHGSSARKTMLPFAPFLVLGALAAMALGAPHAL
jgi:leader peptidase (prepilin peptidase)/N-methyltransferase